jgi:SPP1 family predicted phage head-tail adaptor
VSSLRAGRLRHRVTIERAAESRDAHGGVALTWSRVATRWAGIEPVSGREFIASEATQANVSHRIMLRAGGLTITSRDRIRFGDRVFGITTILNRDERGAVLEIMATEGVSG